MELTSHRPSGRGLRVLAVDLRAGEYDTLARVLSRLDVAPQLLGVSASPKALAELEQDDLAVVVSSLAYFLGIPAPLRERWDRGSAPPVLLLVSPGEEAAASALLGHLHIELVVRAGDYLPLLAAWLPRGLNRRLLGWEEIGRIIRHEINNPLTGMLGNAELILAGPEPLPIPVRNRLSTIINLAVRMRDVVRTLEERLRQQGSAPPPGSPSDSLSAQPLPR
jgi:signal transduction histidine kinase